MASSDPAVTTASRRPHRPTLLVALALAVSGVLALPVVGSPRLALALTTTMTVAVHDSHHVPVGSTKVGAAVHAAVSLTGLTAPTGTVTIVRYGAAACAGKGVVSKPAALVSGKADVASFPFLPTDVGTYSFGASYSPAPGSPYLATHACKSFSVGKATPTLTIVFRLRNDGVVPTFEVGQWVEMVTTVAGPKGVPVPIGYVTIRHYTNSTCTQNESPASTTLLYDGTVRSAWQPQAPVTQWYRATYSADPRYTYAISPCARVSITRATPAVNAAIHDPGHVTVSSVVVGKAVHAFVRVRGYLRDLDDVQEEVIPTGAVRGNWYSDSGCTTIHVAFGPVPLVSGQVDIVESTQVLSPGTYGLRLEYGGNTTYRGTFSPCLHLTVTSSPTPVPATPTAHATTAPVSPTRSPAGPAVPTTGPTMSATSTGEPSVAPTAVSPSGAASPAASPTSPSTETTGQPVDPLLLVVVGLLVIAAVVLGLVFGRRRGGRPGPAA